MTQAPKPARLEQDFARGVALHRAGRLREAEAIYTQVLAAEPGHHRALFSLGVLALTVQRNEDAARWLARAVTLQSENVAYHSNLGEAYRRLGRLRDAVDALLRALALRPDFAEGLYNLGVVLRQNREVDGAIVYLERAVDLDPRRAVFQQGLGEALRESGDLARAAGAGAGHLMCAWLLSGVSPRPEGTFASGSAQPRELGAPAHERALALEQQGDLRGAVGYHEIAVDARPDEPRFHLGLARALRALGSRPRAIAHYHCAFALDERSTDALVELSGVLEGLSRAEGTAVASSQALRIDPGCAMAHASLAAAHVLRSRYDDAIASCRRALALDADLWLAHFQLGYSLAGTGEVAGALAALGRVLELRPDHDVAHSALLFLAPYAPGLDARAIGEQARAWAQKRAAPLAGGNRPHDNDRDPEKRLRVGLVSADLYRHVIPLFLLRPLLESLDRGTIEVFCYASVRSPDGVTDRMRALSDAWRDVLHATDSQVADLVREDRIDILVDLTMHASGGRPLVFARRPAPVQMCWLAYPGTTGLSTIDYRLTDPYLDPPGTDTSVYSERTVRLRDTFWLYHPDATGPAVGPLPARRNGHVTFGSLNSFFKVNPDVIALWARVLRAVDGSRLVVLAPPGDARERMARAFASHGVGPGRLDIVGRKPREDYLASYGGIDVALDPFPYGGHTTSLDSLWMGVPVVTLVGETLVGRAGLSQVTNLGLAELAATTPDEYVRIAVDLASDLDRLGGLRATLRSRMEASPLMDAPRFARNFEQCCREAWRAWCGAS
jgi:predicted O-linked N-acetylglucosamine transferase (SPINDLY family)